MKTTKPRPKIYVWDILNVSQELRCWVKDVGIPLGAIIAATSPKARQWIADQSLVLADHIGNMVHKIKYFRRNSK